MGASAGDRWAEVGAEYEGWLSRQPLSANTKRTYRTWVSQFLKYLETTPVEYGDPLEDLHARDYAVRDYKGHLKAVRKAKPSSVNLSLAAIDNFYLFLGMGRPEVRREDLAQAAPKSLSAEEQKRFLRAVERSGEIRDRAMALLLFYAGLRLGELCGLDVEDVAVTARKGQVVVRSGKGDKTEGVRTLASNYDLVVIGGTAGLVSATGAALVERNKLGGDCLYRECVLTKTLVKSARVASPIGHSEAFGIKTAGYEVGTVTWRPPATPKAPVS